MTYSSLTPEAALGSNHPLPVIASPSATVPTSRERGPEKSGITGCEPQQRIIVWNSKPIRRDPSRQLPIGRLAQDDRGVFYTTFASLWSGIAFQAVINIQFQTPVELNINSPRFISG